jgi:hypothetical protein
MTQRERLLRYAIWRGQQGFTRLDAVREVGIFELASRIGELEKTGHRFNRQRETVITRFGGNVSVTRYFITAEFHAATNPPAKGVVIPAAALVTTGLKLGGTK